MGFGVSGSTAIIFLGVLVATGSVYTATSNAAEDVLDAHHADEERALTRANTDVTVANATYANGTLVVNVTNTGSATLRVDETTLLVDNAYTAPNATSVGGDATTNLWYGGENLTMTIDTASAPGRVKVVTATGVAATGVVA